MAGLELSFRDLTVTEGVLEIDTGRVVVAVVVVSLVDGDKEACGFFASDDVDVVETGILGARRVRCGLTDRGVALWFVVVDAPTADALLLINGEAVGKDERAEEGADEGRLDCGLTEIAGNAALLC